MFEGEGVLMFGCTSLLLLFAPGYISLRHDVDVFGFCKLVVCMFYDLCLDTSRTNIYGTLAASKAN